MPPKNRHGSTPITSVKHKDKRVNIPTEELRDFVADEERNPKAILYPRDPSLDPQLVWKGKDEQDQGDLAVPAVPLYIQEKIHPQAIIEGLRTLGSSPADQPTLFRDFNGLSFDELVDFYQHEQNWTNRIILGDSLLAMTSLAEKEGLKGKVQMIYMDPPYGIKFGSNWQVSTRNRDVRDGKVENVTRQPEQIRAFRDTWSLGIHSYLSYLRDRLTVARDLLSDSGSVFIQIGDENVHLVRCLLDEVFGSENFSSLITVRKTGGLGSGGLTGVADFILWYSKDKQRMKFRSLYTEKSDTGTSSQYGYAYLSSGDVLAPRKGAEFPDGSRQFQPVTLHTMYAGVESCLYEFEVDGKRFKLPPNRQWSTTLPNMLRLYRAGRIFTRGNTPRFVRYLDDFSVNELTNLWSDVMGTEDKIYVVQTATRLIERCLLMTTDPGDLVLDPTCGSGTTAFVAEQWGRRWITIDTSRVSLALARTRLMSARYPYYLLADSPEGIKKENEITGQPSSTSITKTDGDMKRGFVYKRVPHVTLRSIANNSDIDQIYERWQAQLESIRAKMTQLLKRPFDPWEIPHEPDYKWPKAAKDLLAEWWKTKHARQAEIDVSIARHADREWLYDQPYEDTKRVRVAGPFTVESLSPHRVLSIDDERPTSESTTASMIAGRFETMILDNLRKAGVQTTRKKERLQFDRLETYPGTWLQGAGEFTDADGSVRRVAVSIGPEHGTVGPEQIKEAAKEAMRGAGFDLLIVCGFAFDAHAPETVKEFTPTLPKRAEHPAWVEGERQYGKLPVMLARMNPDLAMGDELLKKTGAGNLFMVFGEPDVKIMSHEDGRLVVEIKGVDVYDPTSGQIRSSSTEDIACWFIDTNYNNESFFVRHAYFTGADEPYDRLQRALRAEIDESAWATLYSTKSRPFERPSTGKIAIKVINHYGDEVLKVFEA